MKFGIALVLGVTCLVLACSARPADDYDYNDAGTVQAKPSARSNPLLNRRNPLSRPGNAKSTTTTTAAPLEEEEEEIPEDEFVDEEEAPAETSSTTEAGRKLKGGIIRPFRSNQELLDKLKKRREQAVSNKALAKASAHDAQESAPVASESEKPKARPSSGGARPRYNKKESSPHAEEQESSSTPATRTSARRFRN